MSRRLIAVLAVTLVAVPAVAAQANSRGVKRVCNILTDPTGDATRFFVSVGVDPWPNVAALDIKSADVASNASMLTTVIRVATLRDEPTAPGGQAWTLYFTLNDQRLYTRVEKPSGGNAVAEVGYYLNATYNELKSATAVFDTAKNEVRVNAPVLAFAPKPVPNVGLRATSIEVQTARLFPGLPEFPADVATTKTNYVFGTPSCVPVGK